eukprot:12713978-Alexandrium_andersonii.AAC.1
MAALLPLVGSQLRGTAWGRSEWASAALGRPPGGGGLFRNKRSPDQRTHSRRGHCCMGSRITVTCLCSLRRLLTRVQLPVATAACTSLIIYPSKHLLNFEDIATAARLQPTPRCLSGHGCTWRKAVL